LAKKKKTVNPIFCLSLAISALTPVGSLFLPKLQQNRSRAAQPNPDQAHQPSIAQLIAFLKHPSERRRPKSLAAPHPGVSGARNLQ
jgi:hypothetical protein